MRWNSSIPDIAIEKLKGRVDRGQACKSTDATDDCQRKWQVWLVYRGKSNPIDQ
jgi:hypothetical protein